MKTTQLKKMKLCAMALAASATSALCVAPILAHEITGSPQHALISPPQGNLVMNMFATGAMFGILGVTLIATKNKK